VLVDDTNWEEPRRAVEEFCAGRPEARLALSLPTPGLTHPSFWNGLTAIDWKRDR
jgi:hypothetical protein